MELYQLRTFVAVAEEEHLTRAAERLFVSQPSVSTHIKALEDELGVKLFTRTPKGMTLTPAGAALKPKAEEILSASQELMYQAKSMNKQLVGDVRLGLNTDSSFLRIQSLLQYLERDYPRLSIQLMQSLSGFIRQDLSSGKMDAGFIYGESPHPSVVCLELCKVDLVVVAPAAWKLKMKKAELPDLARIPWIWMFTHCPFCRMAEELFFSQDLKPEKVLLADDEGLLRDMVAAGKGLTLMRRDFAEEAMRAGELCIWDKEPMTISSNFAYLEEREKDPMIQAIIRCVKLSWGLTDCLPGHKENAA